MKTNKELFETTIEDLKDIDNFYRISCTTCRSVELLDEDGKAIPKNAKIDCGIINELSTQSGKYNCKSCVKKFLENPLYDLEQKKKNMESIERRIKSGRYL